MSIGSIAEKLKLLYLEDAAQAHGTRYRSRRVGGQGHAAPSVSIRAKTSAPIEKAALLPRTMTRLRSTLVPPTRTARQHATSTIRRLQLSHARISGRRVYRIKLRYFDRWTARRQEIAREYRRVLANAKLWNAYDPPERVRLPPVYRYT